MDLEFPRIVYRAGGPWQLESGAFSVRQVDTANECEAALADGWHLDQYAAGSSAAANLEKQRGDEAKQAGEEVQGRGQEAEGLLSPPTRAELEQKARELGLKFDGRTTDKRLGAMIAAALPG